ncbi:PorV/PorQ family protein [Flavobacterium urocaniciphilum]|uniref:Long-chain fatty acid transport protein n=1 Tax=Flavobacterium urocaniciphilum TaxID=1299341 RepID=A0A1H9AGH1_9FLAO|nr:hypothetical protein [Flavobacterium urocaniciphilum]SEP75685.1 hypothetical protein SAMN05444005_102137 [Flavobacterium urocaniciphilum]
MIKRIALIVTILLANFGFAQENTPSPYSFYGIGVSRFKGTNDIVNMGGISVYADSTHINVLNPATYSNQIVTNFQIGGTSSFYKLNAGSTSEKAKKTTFDYFTVSFPLFTKWGVSTGILPQSAVGYRFIRNNGTVDGTFSSYLGKGGVNKVYLGTGYKITKKLSLGIDFQYLFGSIDTQSQLYQVGVQYGSQEINESTMSGVAFNTGLTYNTALNKKLNLMTSVMFSPEATLNSNNVRTVSTVSLTGSGVAVPVSSQEVSVPDSKLNIPSKIAFGAGVGNRKWFFGGDVTLTGSSNQLNRFDNYENVSFENGSKIAFGGFILPKYDSYNNYLQRITYRAGFRFENTGLVINNTSIKDKAVNFGLGLPISGTFSSINIGVEYGVRGTVMKGLVREDYFGISVGLLFNDKWFKKTLYN